jgi:hypothetical protein
MPKKDINIAPKMARIMVVFHFSQFVNKSQMNIKRDIRRLDDDLLPSSNQAAPQPAEKVGRPMRSALLIPLVKTIIGCGTRKRGALL